ncbi:MAG: gluconate 2-dehydrogenase subunit 3 family protein [Saprospiraceae bacterium]|nr:gluconate 2-dehydrogenase subunit 3 family protein [Saprospiraceae bacterium]
MKRREAIQSATLAAAGLIALPAWAKGWTLQTLPKTPSIFPLLEQNTLSSIIEAIIPESDTLGAKSVGVPAFIEKMLADCYEKEVVDNVMKGLAFIENTALSNYNKPFPALSLSERQAILLSIDNGTDKSLKDFYTLIKNLTIQGYTTSEYVQINFLEYNMTPGFYKSFVPLNC